MDKKEHSVVSLFSERLSENSNALEQGNRSLSYAALDQASDHLAQHLINRGVASGSLIGVSTERSIETIVGLLAILKAGCGYVPLPEYYPQDRLALIIEQANISIVLGNISVLESHAIQQLSVDLNQLSKPSSETFNPPSVNGETIAYVMFTSGSTGTPKGVAVPHRAIVRLVHQQNFMQLNERQRILQNSPVAFDASTLEIWGALLNGATLVIPEEQHLSLRVLGNTIREKNITAMWLTAGLFHAMADERPEDFKSLQQLLTGGDVVSPDKVARVLSVCPNLTVINGYGPTENTTFTCCHTIQPSDLDNHLPLPIGKPINGTDVFILDDSLQPVEEGAEGELCTTGLGLALGYLGQDALTQQVFVQAPWNKDVLLYRTGDLARKDKAGVVHYLGRIDSQVKIRGFRIELGEIEKAIESFSGIQQSVVVAKPSVDGADKRLYAFYVSTSTVIDEQALLEHIKHQLPDYSIPSILKPIDSLPLNTNGKIDRKKILDTYCSEPVVKVTKNTSVSRYSDAEKIIVNELSFILGVTSVDVTLNFFELGTSSLHIARLHERLEKILQREISITDLFLHSSVKSLADHLSGRIQAHTAHNRFSCADHSSDDIAIIGMSGRFPNANSVAEFWQALVDGKELISQLNDDELDIAVSDEGDYVKARGILANADYFDAQHFGIPPKDAEKMDPQHRILLEVAQEALDDAGYDPQRYGGKIGVFAGSSQNSYLLNNIVSTPGAARQFASGYPVKDFATLFGNDKDFNVTRIAYKLNLQGPAVNVQCACSTSLVAVAQACESLLKGTSDMALAGGVSITFPQKRPYLYTPDGMASADGHCRTFDAEATGTVFGDGAGLVVLKRLQDAKADGDDIVAVIRGYSINNDGSDKAGYAAPSAKAQANVIQAAHQAAGVDARTIGYVEAHGTGTPLGDPIEFAALQDAFGRSTQDTGFCALGTAKTNVGHLDIAAGVTGLIKAAMTLKTGVIPPLLHYQSSNPNIHFEQSAFYPVTKLTSWPSTEEPRRAGVSAFGVGGTNIHMVLEEPPITEKTEQPEATGWQIYPLSASSEAALQQRLSDFSDWCREPTLPSTASILDTLRYRRQHYRYRQVIVAKSIAELPERVTATGKPCLASVTRSRLVMLLPGQGSQHVGMAAELYQQSAVFREHLDYCARFLKQLMQVDLLEIIHAPEARRQTMTEQLKDTRIAQPAIFAIEYALVKQWQHWGIEPDILMGHSIGELAAACVAGVIALDDALKMIALRGQLMSDLPGGAMLSVRASEQEVHQWLERSNMDLAAVNGAKACVVAGSTESAERLSEELQQAGMVCSLLHTSHAFHSRMMDAVVEPFAKAFSQVTLRPPGIPLFSTVTGNWLTDEDATNPHYWANHLRQTVRFYDGLHYLWENEPNCLFLEVGPGKTLATLAGQNPDRRQMQPALASLPHAQDEADDYQFILRTYGLLWANGYNVDWQNGPGAIARGVSVITENAKLPSYPFQRQRYWIEPTEVTTANQNTIAESEAVNQSVTKSVTIIDQLKEMLSELSGFEAETMAIDQSFLDMGFDSLLLTQAIKELSDQFSVKVSLRQLIDGFNTLQQLSDHIEQHGVVNALSTTVSIPKGHQPSDKEPIVATPSSAPVTRIQHDSLLDDLLPAQRAHIQSLIERFNKKTPQSKALTQHYRPWHADPRTASGFNRLWKELVYQIITVQSKGSRLVDIDGNEYIDILNGFGPGFLGHGHPDIIQALHQQVDTGFEVGPQSLLAMEAAQLFCEVTGNDRASFVCTGSEAVYAAMRLARTCTGRDKIVMFARDYHGNFDEVLVRGIQSGNGPRTMPLAPGIPRDAVKNVIVLPYGTAQSLDYIRHNADQLAAVMIEPVQSRRPEFQPFEFVREVRAITQQAGALLIFDEVVTGFRFGPRGAQAFYGVEADLITYGKVIGGGMPLGVVSGKAQYMDTFDGGQWQYGDDSFPQAPVTFFAGTFVRHPLVMASLKSMLMFFKRQPDYFWKAVNAKGDQLAGTVNRWFADNDMPFELPNCGSLMYLRIPEEQKYGALLGAHLRDRGVFILEGFPSYMTAAHDNEDINHIIDAVKDSALEMRADHMITGREPVAYEGPKVQSVLPRLLLPDGAEKIEQIMLQPLSAPLLPMTEAQKEIWLAVKLGDEMANLAYNESISLRFNQPIDIDIMIDALKLVIDRHGVLRLRFGRNGQYMEFVDNHDIPIVVHTMLSNDGEEPAMKTFLKKEMSTPFDIDNGPLARVAICRLPEGVAEVVLTAHHIICDGWSFGILLNELSESYNALLSQGLPSLSRPDSYEKYAIDEYKTTQKKDIDYWLNIHNPPSPDLELPADGARLAQRTFAAQRIDLTINKKTTDALRQLSKLHKVSFFVLMYSAFCAYLSRLCQRDDMVVGVPYAGQLISGMNNLVGHCVHILPFRVRPVADQSFSEFLQQTNQQLLEGFDHPQVTMSSLLSAMSVPRDASRVPLVPVTFNLDQSLGNLKFGQQKAEFVSHHRIAEPFELALNLEDQGDQLCAQWSFNTQLCSPELMYYRAAAFNELLDQLASSADYLLKDLPILSSGERQLLNQWNMTFEDMSNLLPVTTSFLQMAQQFADCDAVEFGQKVLTYQQALERVHQIIATIQTLAIPSGSRIAVSLSRSEELPLAMMAVMMAGCAYIPLDPSQPEQRLLGILQDAQVSAILCDHEIPASHNAKHIVNISTISAVNVPVNLPTITLDSIAYIIYTSGSTGKPKGVAVRHRGLANIIRSFQITPGFTQTDRLLAVTTAAFDIAGLEFFLPLCTGATVVIAPDDTVRDPQQLNHLLHQHHISVLQCVPTTWQLLLSFGGELPEKLRGWCGGEALPSELVNKLPASMKFWNVYGPTETTIWSTLYEVKREKALEGRPIPIGKPIDNTTLYVLDSSGRQVPVGAAGTLWIGGAGVAAGYFNQDELTEERFKKNHLSDEIFESSIYDTGDLVRFSVSGDLEYLGRKDFQVKIRGFRIELGDIESVLLSCKDIQACVVHAIKDPSGNDQLVAYYETLKPAIEHSELRQFLAKNLPDYMIPAHFVTMDALPLNTNGKIDRGQLPALSDEKIRVSDLKPTASPKNDLELIVVNLFKQYLSNVDIGMDDDFFDYGGDSMSAIELIVELNKQLNIELPLAILLAQPTPQKLTNTIRDADKLVSFQSIIPLSKNAHAKSIFCLMGIQVYAELAEALGDKYSVYALLGKSENSFLQGVLSDDESISVINIEALAEEYLRLILDSGIEGPYRLMGFSSGGVVAIEVARRLQQRGQQVELVVLLDSVLPRSVHEKLWRKSYRKIKYSLIKVCHGLGIFDISKRSVEKNTNLYDSKLLEQRGELLWKAIEKWDKEKRHYSGQVVLFSATDLSDMGDVSIDRGLGWKEVIDSDFPVVDITGNHDAILSRANTRKIAEYLESLLNQTESG